MASFEIVLILLLAVVLSAIVTRASPVPVPVPLVQIVIGVLISAVADLGVRLDPELFFVLFLPPLLFFDSWRVPKENLMRDKVTILALAFGLVVFTVLGVGVLVHWMIPAMPLAVAFALTAIISPTDPVAVTAIAARTPVPNRLMRILEGESLLNDASGLVCMRFAVVAVLTGAFSPLAAVGSFLWLAIGGVVVGATVTAVVALAKDWATRHYGENTESQILISLLIPFGAYMSADAIGCSGVLAAVAAGVAMSYFEQMGGVLAVTRVRRSSVWETIRFGASGAIFILLGEQLPDIAAGAARVVRETGHSDLAWLAVYVVAINLAVAAVRFAWVWMSLRFLLYRAGATGSKPFVPGVRLTAAASLAGVRGTVTLAGVLTLPLTLADGAPFPARDLAIFLAAGVIIASLVAAAVLLPGLFKGLRFPAEVGEEGAEDRARIAAGKAALEAVAGVQRAHAAGAADADLYADAAARVIASYRRGIDARTKTGAARDAARAVDTIERRLLLVGSDAERREINRLARSGKLSDEAARKIVREIDLLEARIAGP